MASEGNGRAVEAAFPRVGPWHVDPALNRIDDGPDVHHLEPQVMDLLVYLATNAGRVVSKDDIISAVWNGRFISEATLTRSMSDLRSALGDDVHAPQFIETISKRGYRLVAPVSGFYEVAGTVPVGALDAGASGATSGDAALPKLVVLPFVNMGEPGDDKYFADGLTEEVITVLTRVPGLRVIARTSAFAAQRGGAGLADVAALLGVTHVLEGSVRRAGSRLRVTAQLIRASDQCHIWGERYDRDVSDVFAIQDEIAAALAAKLRLTLGTGRRGAAPPTADIEAYAWYLEGRHHFLAGTPEALFRGEVCYEHAIARDPSFALAHDAQSELYWYMGFYGIMAPREAFSRSLWESLRAIELDETMAEAHALLGMLRKEQDHDWAEVRREFDRALELNPASPVVRFRHALSGLMPHGHTREAAAELERVLETDPLSLFVRWWLYVMWFLSGDMERVRVSGERMVALDASHTLSLHALGGSLLLRGDAAAAVEPFERAASLSGRPPWLLGWLGLACAAAGRPDAARAVLAEMSERSKTSYVSPFAIALTCLGLGDVDGVFKHLDAAIDVRDPWIVPIRTFPLFDPLRSDPRFGALLRKMRLDA